MILILMTARSGSSLVAKIFAAHGFDCGDEKVFSYGYETFENEKVNQWIRDNREQFPLTTGQPCEYVEGIEDCIPPNAVVKVGVEYLGLFKKMNPKVIGVKRDIQSIAKSWSDKHSPPRDFRQHLAGARIRMRAIDRIVREYNGAIIDTDKIMAGDFSGVKAAFEHFGLEYDEDKARACVDPEKWHKW